MEDYDEEVMQFSRNTAINNSIQNQEILNAFEMIQPKRKYTIFKRVNPFAQYDEQQFKSRYRSTKAQAIHLYISLDGAHTLEPMTQRENFDIPGLTKLLMALRFYAVGCYSEPLADMFGVSATTVRNAIAEVSYLICLKLKDEYLKMPQAAELFREKARFHRIAGFPLVIGAVDGTFIKVKSFGGQYSELYQNRKGYFSINCQIMVSGNVRNEVCHFFIKILKKLSIIIDGDTRCVLSVGRCNT